MSFRGQVSWAKMTSPGDKLTALACRPTKKVNKAEEVTYLSTNIGGAYPSEASNMVLPKTASHVDKYQTKL